MKIYPGVALAGDLQLFRYILVDVGTGRQEIGKYGNILCTRLDAVIDTTKYIRLSKLKKCGNNGFVITGAVFFNLGCEFTYLMVSDFFSTSMGD